MYERRKDSKNKGQISRQKYFIKNKKGLKFSYAKVTLIQVKDTGKSADTEIE
jgi:hypothetical protein